MKAHWTGLAGIGICVLCATAAADPLPTADVLTEGVAAQWSAHADEALASVDDDLSAVRVGEYSLRFDTTGCFTTWLTTPPAQDAAWDLPAAGSGGIAFWLRATNENGAFQGPSPWVRFCTSETDYYECFANRDYAGEALSDWVYVSVPVNGNATWTTTISGSPALNNINFIRIYADTWGCNFTLWFDGLTFDVAPAPPERVVAIAGNHQVALNWKPYNDIIGQFARYAIYRATTPFTSTIGLTPLATVTGINHTTYTDNTPLNGTHYYYAVTAQFTGGGETNQVEPVGPRTPRDETDLQVTYISRTPRYPRYAPEYSGFWVTEPSGFGPYFFTSATGLGNGQDEFTPRWPNLGDTVTYTATVRNRGTNTWSGTLGGTWRVDNAAVTTPSQSVTLAPGATTTFTYANVWDNVWHEIKFMLNLVDATATNNERRIWTKSAPFLTYVDAGFAEDFREKSTPAYPLAVTGDMVDWLQRHADEMNDMFIAAGSTKRVHYDLLEVINDADPDPDVDRMPFGIFPFRYYGTQWGDPRAPGYYHAAVDIDYGLCHEMSHQLGLVDIYQLDISSEANLVSTMGYTARPCLMHGCSPFYSDESALGMTQWADIVHGYYGQYMYHLPQTIKLRILDFNGQPLPGATIKMYQVGDFEGLGHVVSTQIKAQGTTDAAGEWTLPNVPIDSGMVPPTFGGDVLHDNPFGYLAVVGTNGVLHFKIEYDEFVDYAWLDICDVNVAYWQGQTTVARFDKQVAIGGAVQNVPPVDLAEQNAANWTSWAQDGTITLSNDTTRVHNGAASVKGVFTGGYDNYVRYPYGILAKWNLSGVNYIRFWAYAENPNGGFQNGSPWVRLGSYQDGYFEWHPTGDILNEAIGQWREFVVPIPGDATWQRSAFGTPSLTKINYFELHADTWGYGFTLWLDGVRFDPQPTPPVCAGDGNCDGNVNWRDIDYLIAAQNDNQSAWSALFPAPGPSCTIANLDCSGDGHVNWRDIDPFIALMNTTCP
jgi:hypothetical protein